MQRRIAVGATAEVYAWQGDTVLKLFNTGVPLQEAQFEAELTRKIHAAGVKIPAVIDVIEVEGRPGIIYERVYGHSLFDHFSRQPWRLFEIARLSAELHYNLHQHHLPNLRPMRARLERKIMEADLDERLKQSALADLKTMPDGGALCHGDFHPYNIMVTANGPVIIDWIDATTGSPLADVARTLILVGLGEPSSNFALKTATFLFRQMYLNRYLRLSGVSRHDVMRWIPVVAAARLNENVSHKATLRKIVEKAY